jgi:hypothetical protein
MGQQQKFRGINGSQCLLLFLFSLQGKVTELIDPDSKWWNLVFIKEILT